MLLALEERGGFGKILISGSFRFFPQSFYYRRFLHWGLPGVDLDDFVWMNPLD